MRKQRNFRTLFLGAATVLLAIWVANPVIAAVQQKKVLELNAKRVE